MVAIEALVLVSGKVEQDLLTKRDHRYRQG